MNEKLRENSLTKSQAEPSSRKAKLLVERNLQIDLAKQRQTRNKRKECKENCKVAVNYTQNLYTIFFKTVFVEFLQKFSL